VVAEAKWRRRLALAALAEARLREGFLGRAASVYGWGVAVSYAALVLLAPASSFVLFRRAVATALGVVGTLVAAALLRDLLGDPQLDVVRALARESGFDGHERRLARALAALFRLSKAVGVPGSALLLVTLGTRLFGLEP
jgi:hypothetical protein